MKKKIIIPSIFAVAVLALAVMMSSSVSAQNDENGNTLSYRIAQRFGLNETEVREEFDTFRDERRADMYAKYAERLNDLMAEGKLTKEQRDKILEKHEEMQDMSESMRDLSPEERREQMESHRGEMKAFMEEIGVDEPLMMGPMGKGGEHGGKEFGMRGRG